MPLPGASKERCRSSGHDTRNCNICNNYTQDHVTADCPSIGATAEGAVEYQYAKVPTDGAPNARATNESESWHRPPINPAVKRRRYHASDHMISHHYRQDNGHQSQGFDPFCHKQLQKRIPRRGTPSPFCRDHPIDEELLFLVSEVLIIKSCRTRVVQMRTVTSLISKYGN